MVGLLFRAAIALLGLGPIAEMQFIPASWLMAKANPDRRELLHVALLQGPTPPVDAFWSLTMYDEKGFPVENPINRNAIGDRDRLKFNDDGSLTLYISTNLLAQTRNRIGCQRPRAVHADHAMLLSKAADRLGEWFRRRWSG